MRPSLAIGLLTLAGALAAPSGSQPLRRAADGRFQSQNDAFSGDVTACKGYSVDSVQGSATGGLLASLSILNRCSAYGNDIPSLTLSVEYETQSRLHVHLYDTPLQQYQLDNSILPRPQADGTTTKDSSDLQFDYNSSPFEFWVTRKSDNAVLFDTRAQGIPTYDDEIEIEGTKSNYTLMPAHPLVFEDQYLQISSALPVGANIYGLGEVIAETGYRRNASASIQTMWARDVGDPIDENMYGIHPMYMELRWDDQAKKTKAHGAFLLNSNGMDIVLRDGVIQYRAIGGTFDFYFFSGPDPNSVAEQYAQTVGMPQQMPFWSFGFHLCRWGYTSIADTRANVEAMKAAGIPLEVQWNDIDWMRRYREFQFDVNFDPTDYKAFVDELHSNKQHYIPIIDAAIGIVYNESDSFDVYTRGHELGVWMHNPDGTEYIGQVWPGYTVFPDWFNPQMEQVWYEAFYNLSQVVDFDGIWLDMNEPSSFVTGTQANSTLQLNETLKNPSSYPNPPPPLPNGWPEGYNNDTSGNSGNITVNGQLTYGQNGTAPTNTAMKRAYDVVEARRAVQENIEKQKRAAPRSSYGTAQRDTTDLTPAIRSMDKRQMGGNVPNLTYPNNPAYPIRNGFGALSERTVDTNVVHSGGLQEYNVHNVWGTMEEIATNNVLYKLKPNYRPFTVARSTFAGIGRKTAHWLGDNYSTWAYMKRSIQGVLQFNLFAVPMVGPDTCGFNQNTDEELCNRWSQLSAFFPFYRNHNTKGAISQEPYRWESVTEASITAINARYSLLPYWESLFAEASCSGTPPVRALFHEFDNQDYYDNDYQFLIGDAILVTPQLQPNSSSVSGTFPSADGVTWTNFFTHQVVDTSQGETVEVDAPLSTIPVHVRSGRVLLMHSDVQYTLTDTRSAGYGLLVTLDGKGSAEGQVKMDDGMSWPVTEQSCITFTATSGSCLSGTFSGNYQVQADLEEITILGVQSQTDTSSITFNSEPVDASQVEYKADTKEVVIKGLSGNLNGYWELKW